MKRTRPIRGKYFLTIPRITHAGRILEIKVKVSQVVVTDLGPAKTDRVLHGTPSIGDRTGEIERGRVDGDE